MSRKRSKNSITYHYNKAGSLAIAVVEKKARAILRRHTNLDEFYMGNGTWFFTRKPDGKIVYGCGTDTCLSYMRGLRAFIWKWDEYLRLLGYPMRFTAYGKKKEE